MAERKAFNFYRSYLDVYNELSEKDKVKFMDALLNKQFFGIEPELNGMAKFAYLSQKHSIDSQVTGYETKTNTTLGGSVGATQGASLQEKGQGEEKVEVKEKGKEERANDFWQSLSTLTDQYEVNLLKDFFEHWTEAGPKAKKMRFEKEKAFDINRRLKTWARNEKKWNTGNTKSTEQDLDKWING